MSHMSNAKEFDVGQDKPEKEVVEKYDKIYGKYESSQGGKPTKAVMPLPGEPSLPMKLQGK